MQSAASCVMMLVALLWAAEASAGISGATATTAGSSCSGSDADGFCGSSAAVLTDNGTTLATRYAWNINADIGVGSTRDAVGTAHHNVDFTATAPGGYRLDVATSFSGDLNRIEDAVNCDGRADVTGVTGSSNVALASGILSLSDPGIIGNGSTTVAVPFLRTSTAQIFGVSNGVGQMHQLDFTWSGSVRSNSCEAAVRLGAQNGTTSSCDACGYPGNPARTQSTDGHFVTVTFTSLCGNGGMDPEVGEQCDDGVANGTLTSCCSGSCQVQPDTTPCDDQNAGTTGDQCLGGVCQGTAATTSTSSSTSTSTSTTTSTSSSTSTTSTTTVGGSTTSTTLGGGVGTPVSAVKLIVVDKGANGAKAVFVSKDGAVAKGAGTDPATIGMTFDFAYDNGTDPASAGQFVAPVGSPKWLVNKSTVAKFVNKLAPTGGGTKVAVIKPGKVMKVVGKNLGDTPIDVLSQSSEPGGMADIAYCVENDGESHCFCSTFTCAWKSIAGGVGAKVVCRAGIGDPTCAALP